jgi:imidazolonepropionase-like amidohydrolase
MFGRVVSSLLLVASAGALAQDTIAITDVTVIDGNGGAPLEDRTVVVSDGRITDISRGGDPLPADALIVQGQGKYLLPGFIDSNVHASIYGNSRRRETVVKYGQRNAELVLEFAQRQLLHGVTTIRDSYGALVPLQEVRDRISRGAATGPRMLVAGNIVGWGGPFSMTFSLMQESELTLFQAKWNDWIAQGVGEEMMDMGPEEVRLAINRYLDKGPDFIKYGGTSHFRVPSLIGFSPRVQKVIVDETHKRGLIAETHATSPEALRMAVEAGIDLIQHPEILSRDYPDDLIELIVDNDVVCAMRSNTLAGDIWRQHLQRREQAEAELRDLPEPKTSAERRQRENRLNLHYETQRRNAERLIRAGCIVSIATDNYQGRAPEFRKQPKPEYQEAGTGSILAIEGLVELGMSEMQAIVAATRNGAVAAGMADRIGTVEAGKLADLILLGADPTEDISNIRRLEQVISHGRLVDLATLPEQRIFYLGPARQWTPPGPPSTTGMPATPLAATAAVSAAKVPDQAPEVAEDGYGTALPVTRVYENNLGKVVVEMENGQVWRQLNADKTRVVLPPDEGGLTADVERSFLGSVSLRIGGTGRSFKVSRIK